MATTYSFLEEEMISQSFQDVLKTLKIYNLLGQEVRTLVHARQSAGEYSVHWDGRDNLGKAVSSGVYIYRLSAGNSVQSKKMVLIR